MPTVTEHLPVKPIIKHEFNSPLDMLEQVAELKGIKLLSPVTTQPPLDLKPLVGTWLNVDKATRGLVRVIVTASGQALSVHVFGACHPTPCDWGAVPAKAFADSVCSTPAVGFTAQYKFNFKETLIVGRLEFGALFVETFDHFIDGSGREDYSSVYILSE
jgi:hypothetical protein